MSSEPVRRFVRYRNRRLYDLDASGYVTLVEVQQSVSQGAAVCVVDKKSGEDLTCATLLQIVSEHERGSHPMLSPEFLRELIQFQNGPDGPMARAYLDMCLRLMLDELKRIQPAISS
jgi:polyhydroxyalkanoate synthesis repressor PhaR